MFCNIQIQKIYDDVIPQNMTLDNNLHCASLIPKTCLKVKCSMEDTCVWKEAPKRGLKIPLSSRFFAQITSRNCLNVMFTSCSRQVYPITLDARLVIHTITQLFSSNSRFHALKYVESRHHASPWEGPTCEAANFLDSSNYSM